MNKKNFITGISGFAGFHLTNELLKNKCSVAGIYYPRDAEKKFTAKYPNVKISLCDILDKNNTAEVIKKYSPDTVFHLAGIASVKYASNNVQAVIDANLKGLANVMEACASLKNRPLVIFISSAEVYNFDCTTKKISENESINPVSPYAITKYAGELLFKYFLKSEKMRGIIVRPFNHIGPYQSPDFSISSFAKKIAEIEKNKNNFVLKTGNLNSERDFTDVRDVVSAYYKISRLPVKTGIAEVYNIASGKTYKIEDLLKKLISLSSVSNKIKIRKDPELFRKIDILKTCGDYSKLNKKCGWKPVIDINETLRDTLDFWRANI